MLEVLFEDEDIWVFNKPTGLSVLKDRTGAPCMWDELKDEAEGKAFLVHRIDKGTSGCLIVAKSQEAQSRLTRDFAQRAVQKFYVARTTTPFPAGTTVHIDLPLCEGRKNRYRVAGQRASIRRDRNTYVVEPDRDGLASQSSVRASGELVIVRPHTGRTHQIRVHLAWIGHPIAGDPAYGRPNDPGQAQARLMLHAHKLVLADGTMFAAPVPADFAT